jgi:histidinol-phosphatase
VRLSTEGRSAGSPSDDLEFAFRLADAADAITLQRFHAVDLQVGLKPDGTPVTDADTSAERALRSLIAAERPHEGVVGEEGGDDGGSTRWILDPIDGTKNFARGIPLWATLIALERQGPIVCALVSAPALGHRWWATKGGGAWRDGRRLQVSSVQTLADSALSCSLGRDLVRVEPTVRHARGLGDFWQHMLVAEGSLDAAVDARLSLWDYAGVAAIVQEAGGMATAPDGAVPRDGEQLICSNGPVHEELLALLREP